jgi:hypothetical protein
MKHFYKVNIYETQAILYWILGAIFDSNGEHFFGKASTIWGWITFVYVIIYSIKHEKEMKEEFND